MGEIARTVGSVVFSVCLFSSMFVGFMTVGSQSAEATSALPVDQKFSADSPNLWKFYDQTQSNTTVDGEQTLRLTEAKTDQKGTAIYTQSFSSSKGITAEFRYYAANGTGADGLTFFLLNSSRVNTSTFSPGPAGRALGYDNNPSLNLAGIEGGYLGFGFDEFGDFDEQDSDSQDIVIRGEGDASKDNGDYPVVVTEDPSKNVDGGWRRVRVTVDPTAGGSNEIGLEVQVSWDGGSSYETIFDVTNSTSEIGGPIPDDFYFGFSGSTGASTNIHAIDWVTVKQPVNLTTSVTSPPANDPYHAGETVQYTFEVTNYGPNDDPSVTLDPTVTEGPSGLESIDWDIGADGSFEKTNTGSITVSINATETKTITLRGTVGTDATGTLDHNITATTSSNFNDPEPDDNNQTVAINLNAAPSFTGNESLADITEDADPANNSGAQINSSELFTEEFSDADGDQFAGIVVTNHASTSGEGTWEYSTDGGATWFEVNGSLSASNGLLLKNMTRLRFDPASDFNGVPGNLTVYAVDDSKNINWTSGSTRETYDSTKDGKSSVAAESGVMVSITVDPVDDAPDINTSAGNTSYTIGDSGEVVAPNVTAQDIESDTVDGARVIIQNKQPGDTLNFTEQHGITGSYDSTNGVLELSGTATPSEYQDVFRSVTFSNSKSDPNTAARRITFSLGTAVTYEGNDHYYEFIDESGSGGITWLNANSSANGKTYFGLQGYLATINSSGENDFVENKVQGSGWLGGSDDLSFSFISENASGYDRWYWVTGPEQGTHFWTGDEEDGLTCDAEGCGDPVENQYTKWGNGSAGTDEEPNDYPGDDGAENYLHIYHDRDGRWNDFPGDNTVDGYVVEYGGMPGDPTITWRDNKTVTLFEPANFSVTIDETNSSVVAGKTLAVNVTVNNTGEVEDTQDIVLKINGTREATESRTIPGGSSKSVNFTYTTGTGDVPAVEVNVSSGNSSDTTTATVNEPANFSVTIDETNASVVAGKTLAVNVTVNNTGDVEDTQDIVLKINGTREATERLTVDSGSVNSVNFTYVTTTGDAPQVAVNVTSDDDYDTAMAAVEVPPNFSVRIDDTNASVLEGETLAVNVTVENTGDLQDTQDIVLRINGTRVDSDGRTISGGGSKSVNFTYATQVGEAPAVAVNVTSNDGYDRTTAVVDVPANFSVSIDDTNGSVIAGETLAINVTVENRGTLEAAQNITLDINGSRQASERKTIDGKSSKTVNFTYTTSIGDAPAIELNVSSNNSTDITTAAVNTVPAGSSPANFSVSIAQTNTSVLEGSVIEVYVTVENKGDIQATQTIEFTINGTVEDSKNITLDPGAKRVLEFTYQTIEGDEPAVGVKVKSADTFDTTTVGVGNNPAPIVIDNNISLTNPNARQLNVSFTTDESVATIEVTIRNVTGKRASVVATLTTGDFTESADSDGNFSYNASTTVDVDGDYRAVLTVAKDAFGNNGASNQSDTVSVDTTGPEPPQNPTASAQVGGEIKVSFEDVDNETSFYTIYRNDTSTVEGFVKVITVLDVNTSRYSQNDTGLSDTTTYEYRISATDGSGNEGANSSTVSATADAKAPIFESATKVNATAIRVRISDLVDTNETSIAASDFGLNGRTAITNISVRENGTDAEVVIRFEPVDRANVTVMIDGSITDIAGNELNNGSKTVYGMDGIAPSITGGDLTLTNPSGQNITVAILSSEPLSTITVSITNATRLTLTRSDFAERATDNGYRYSSTFNESSDGIYVGRLTEAKDAAGNDGASGQTDTVSVDTTSTDTKSSSFDAAIGVSSLVMNFGNVTVGSTVTQNISIKNFATADRHLTVDAMHISGKDPEAFDVVSGEPPFTLEPGETQKIEVEFKPQTAGTKEAQLQIVSNANNSQIDVWLTNERTSVIVQEVDENQRANGSNASTVNIEGVNVDRNTSLRVNITRPDLANRSATVEIVEMRVTQAGNFSVNVTHAPAPVRKGHETYNATDTISLQYVHVEHTLPESAFEDTAFVVRVPRDGVPAGAGPGDLQMLRLENGSWDPQSATLLNQTADALVLRVETDGFSQFVVVGPAAEAVAEPSDAKSTSVIPIKLSQLPGDPGPVEAAAAATTVSFSISLGWIVRPFLPAIIATFFIYFERSFRVGDLIEWENGAYRGVVMEIGFRSTWIRTLDETELTVPNTALTDAVVANAGGDGPLRLEIQIPIDLQADITRAKETIRKAAAGHEAVLDDPSPSVYFREFEDARIRLRLDVWIAEQDVGNRIRIKDDISTAVLDALSEESGAFEYPTQITHDPEEVLPIWE